MITVGLFAGIYLYTLLLIGFAGLLYKEVILAITICFIIPIGIYLRRIIIRKRKINLSLDVRNIVKNKLIILFIILIIFQITINAIGVLSPETAFDSLWYHLTLAKLYSLNHKIQHIPGGLLYYSDMPKLIEIGYAAVLNFGDELLAKSIHFLFSLATLITVYKLAAERINRKAGVIATIILLSNIVFSWEATTAYIDIGRSFFEILALWSFLKSSEKNGIKWLMTTSIFLGFAITTKILAVTSLIIFLLLLIGLSRNQKNKILIIRNSFILIGISLIIPLPWFIFSFIHTRTPFFPFFTNIYKITPALYQLNPIKIITDFWSMMIYASDPISPIYLIMIPLIPLVFKNMKKSIKIIFYYSLFSVILWFATPRTGGGRFILPYLPAISITTAAIIDQLKEQKYIYKIAIGSICIIAISTIAYRGIAEKKYFPIVTGKETKGEFLKHNLNFNFGDFYDTDGYFLTHIKKSDKVLLYGFHNLYYIDFPYIDSSWVKKGEKFNYIALQNTSLPKRFTNWKQVYENKTTHVKLYTDNKKTWTF